MRRAFHGHYWTVAPHFRDTLFPPRIPRDEPWSTTVLDHRLGPLRLTGWLRRVPLGESCVVIVHGMGGRADSRYVLRMAAAAADADLSYLRLSLRGADRSGEDLYHAGLTEDLHAALASPALASFSRLFLVGYSLGGHVVLRWAAEADRDPRVRAVATVCAPLDLSFGAHALQAPMRRPYQQNLLNGLKEMFEAAQRRRRPLPIGLGRLEAIRTLLEWDEEVIAPRFGFDGCEDYYARISAGPALHHVDLPTLFIAAEADPMVTAEQLRPWLSEASEAVQEVWTVGGHVGFPPTLDIGVGAPGLLEPQIVRWLLRTARAR